LTLSPDFVLQARGLFCCAAVPLLPGTAAWPGQGRLAAVPTTASRTRQNHHDCRAV